MAQQLSKFCPHLADASHPLRSLLSSKNMRIWTDVHSKAFNNVKLVLMKPPILAHYDIGRPTKTRTDGSKLHGISVILLQKYLETWKSVAFASRYLSKTEQ